GRPASPPRSPARCGVVRVDASGSSWRCWSRGGDGAGSADQVQRGQRAETVVVEVDAVGGGGAEFLGEVLRAVAVGGHGAQGDSDGSAGAGPVGGGFEADAFGVAGVGGD